MKRYDSDIDTSTRINGIEIDQMLDYIYSAIDVPENAEYQFKVKNHWIDGSFSRTTIGEFKIGKEINQERTDAFLVDADAPKTLSGENRAASPAEYLLHALAACITSTIILHASEQGIVIHALDSEVIGDLDLKGMLDFGRKQPKAYQEIRINITAKTDVNPGHLFHFAQFSPVYILISNCTRVNLNVEVC